MSSLDRFGNRKYFFSLSNLHPRTGLALSIYLELTVTTTAPQSSSPSSSFPLNCGITYEGECPEEVSSDPEVNLITRVALYVLRCHRQHAFPVETRVHIKNPIPLGRGLGSSGAAVTAGVMLGNEVGKLNLNKARMLDYCLMIGMGDSHWLANEAPRIFCLGETLIILW